MTHLVLRVTHLILLNVLTSQEWCRESKRLEKVTLLIGLTGIYHLSSEPHNLPSFEGVLQLSETWALLSNCPHLSAGMPLNQDLCG